MKIWEIIEKAGVAALNVAFPGSGTLVAGLVNEFLPDDKKLPATATGQDIKNALRELPPADRARLMEKEIDVDLTRIKQSNETLRVMLQADEKSVHTTRPYIAKGSFQVVAFCICSIVVIWSYGVVIGKAEIIKGVTDGWPFILSVIGPLVTLLWAYFGILKDEHKNRLNSLSGNQSTGVIGSIISSIKGK